MPAFMVLPHYWVMERTLAWIGRYQRRNKPYEDLIESVANHDLPDHDLADEALPRPPGAVRFAQSAAAKPEGPCQNFLNNLYHRKT
jgi:hypothetical protein